MENKYILGILAIVFAVVVLALGCTGQQAQQPAANETPSTVPAVNVTPGIGTSAKFDATIENFGFSPRVINIAAGTTVVWTNKDSVTHSIVADDLSYQTDSITAGQTYSHTYDKAGTYTYHCGIHLSMKGTVVVTGTSPAAGQM